MQVDQSRERKAVKSAETRGKERTGRTASDVGKRAISLVDVELRGSREMGREY